MRRQIIARSLLAFLKTTCFSSFKSNVFGLRSSSIFVTHATRSAQSGNIRPVPPLRTQATARMSDQQGPAAVSKGAAPAPPSAHSGCGRRAPSLAVPECSNKTFGSIRTTMPPTDPGDLTLTTTTLGGQNKGGKKSWRNKDRKAPAADRLKNSALVRLSQEGECPG